MSYSICRCVLLQLLRLKSMFGDSAFKSCMMNPHTCIPLLHVSATSAFQQRSLHSAGPWRVPGANKACSPFCHSSLPSSPSHAPHPAMISHHRARCVQLPLAGINTRYPQLWAAHAETNARQPLLNRGCVLPKHTRKGRDDKEGEKGPSALKNSGFKVIVPIRILTEA